MAMTIVDASSYTSGSGISLTQMEDLYAWNPDWPQTSASNTIEHFMYDERTPGVVFVYPPASTAAYVEILYVADPTDCATTSDTISLQDQYGNALLYYVLARAFARDPQQTERASEYEALFERSLQIKKPEELTSPNLWNQGGQPPKTT
jgi:hypothetical protein